jgi:hypothetical protein
MKGNAPINVMLPFIFGVLIALVIFFAFIYPSINRILYGACWGNVDNLLSDITSSIDRLQPEQSFEKEIVLGDCIGKIVFTNKKNLASQGLDVTCSPTYQSMVVVTPGFEGAEKTEKELKGVEAKCREIPYRLSYAYIEQGSVSLSGPGDQESEKTYCVTVKETATDTFSITSKPGDC